MANESSGLYTQEDNELLKQTRDARVRALNNITLDPNALETPKEIRLLIELSDSIDGSIHKKAENEARLGGSAAKETVADAAAAIIMAVARATADKAKELEVTPTSQYAIDVDVLTAADLAPGETTIGSADFDPKAFIEEANIDKLPTPTNITLDTPKEEKQP